MLELRDYQERTLEALTAYFRDAARDGAKRAFIAQTDRPYRKVPQLEAMPYVCLRVPTGGGKTLLACHALASATRDYLQVERAVCLWLVPSNAIRDQTLAALRDRQHPYRQALDAHFAGQVAVMDLAEALYVTPGTLAGATAVIVSTLAALRVEDTEGRKVYESSGSLMGHFAGADRSRIEGEGGVIDYSLANVLRIHRPVVVMDEAHNARTPLSFDTLARFSPSCVIEFTATPQTDHNPTQGVFASNVLYQVTARELKAAEMIKLPIRLRTRADWKEVIGDAIEQHRSLEAVADEEGRETGEYIRPIVLFQAQPKSSTRATITTDVLRKALVDDFRIPAEQIKLATGSDWELDGIDLFARSCPVRYVVTVQALREGWDCSFAYILCSVAEQHSARSVEQLLGRILRLPRAKRKRRDELNRAYAFAASPNFVATAQSLKDGLVENGFQKLEAADLVVPDEQPSLPFGGSLFDETTEPVTAAPELNRIDPDLAARVTFDPNAGTLTVRGVLSAPEIAALRDCVAPADRWAVERLYDRSRGRTPAADAPRAPFRVPALAVRVNGQLELFEADHFLDFEWDLAACDATLTEAEFSTQAPAGRAGEIDVSEAGRVEMKQQALEPTAPTLFGGEPGWTLPALANWLDRQFAHRDIPQSQSSLFIRNVVEGLMQSRGQTLEWATRAKYRLRDALEAKVQQHRAAAERASYQRTLFGPTAAAIEVSPDVCFRFDEDGYAPNWYYVGTFRFAKHAFRYVGELKPEGEEFDCAAVIDGLPGVKRWVRNLERRPASSFWLQTATDRFYPDFVAELVDGRFLVVEYKGADRWSNDDSREKRAVGELWEERSNGRCLFDMPCGPDWGTIRAKAGTAQTLP